MGKKKSSCTCYMCTYIQYIISIPISYRILRRRSFVYTVLYTRLVFHRYKPKHSIETQNFN